MFPFPFSFIAPVADIPVEQIANAEAMSFNGTDQYVSASYSGNVQALSLWFKPNSAITTSSSPQYIINFGGNWNGIGFGDFTNDLTNELKVLKEQMKFLKGLRIPLDDINDSLEEIWSYLIGTPYDKNRGDLLKNMNIQTNNYFNYDFKSAGELLCL